MEIKVENLNQALIICSKELIKNGITRKTRGFDCIELPEPVMIEIQHPCDRYVTIKERKWNKYLGFVESLWIAQGLNNMEMPYTYLKRLMEFSDDRQYMRAGYGPRIRKYNGNPYQYKIDDMHGYSKNKMTVAMIDQLEFVVDILKKDINTRQALISIHDPAKDDFDVENNMELLITKDQPCTRVLQFMMVDDKLNLTAYFRSNDLIWGLSAVNVFNFTFMQEYVASILGVPVGKYYHVVNNLHIYTNFLDMTNSIAKLNIDDYKTKEAWYYEPMNISLEEFDDELFQLSQFEQDLRRGFTTDPEKPIIFDKPFFYDWAMVFYRYWYKDDIKFVNPYLNNLFYEEK